MALTASVEDFTAVGVVPSVGSSFTFRPLLVDPAVVTRAPWSVRVDAEGTFTTQLPGGPVKITATANGWRSIDVAGYPETVTLTELLTATNPDGSLKYVIDPSTLQPLNPLPPSAAEILVQAGQARDDAQAVAAALPGQATDAVAVEVSEQVAPLVADAAGQANSAAASKVQAASSATAAGAASATAQESANAAAMSATAASGVVTTEVPPLIASEIANPETAANSAVQVIVDEALQGFIPTSVPREFYIGTVTSTARPVWAGPVWWLTTVDTRPAAMIAGDTWRYIQEAALPDILLAADSFTRADGAAGSTPTGAYPWQNFQGGRSLEIVSNKARFVPGTAASYSVVDVGASDVIVEAVMSTVGAGHNGGLGLRYTDTSNQISIAQRVSGTDFHYRIVNRVGGVIDSRATTAFSADGDVVRVELSGLHIVMHVNGVLAYEGDLASSSAATKHGLYNGNSTSVAETFDDFKLWVKA
ncbi:MAG TPA: hypothetical protein VNJ54_07880 [Plantibacter sp.]|uniref:hypothetical protein n=1 Tax=Plantibacter sp. TaxID=1871045 RepID=UPI002BB2E43B|nr:hypothetical protein [Plantibacter sp.]